ncbi:MAG: wax ester/triacylglycerol synthase family O-acyltransferase [Deltaproteobacteria bacterium]|nr:wax ester/triacylglycerol synthase family O-acyltransferase [Deltaproteobacteria bacterium]MBW2501101.1 wax ester/triacylglycerol synthase family O-acyltransferase [Deltaproteobacteria bacterium]
MSRYTYERLSAQDHSFLLAETESTPMHVGAVGILEAETLRNADGGVDIDRFRGALESILHWIPRYRQKLAWSPFEEWPAWIDDPHFDLGCHVRHIALPAPGSLEQLREIAGRIFSRRLDRERPLWELWVIEGLHEGEQIALLNKIHHCMIDGAAGADLSQILFSPSPSFEENEPLPYYPRPAPTAGELISDRLRGGLGAPLRALRMAREVLSGERGELVEELTARARSLRDLGRVALKPSSPTPINGELGPHRRVDWLTMPLDDVRELRRALECTINDVVLTVVTGAVRRYLFRRRVDATQLDFRISAPVSMRRDEHRNKMGNHVSSWILQLPLDVDDPLEQIEVIRERTAELKRTNSALAIDTVMAAAEYLPPALLRRGANLASGPVNSIVTNVPGPQFPLYTVGARLLGMYPVVPLIPGCGLGVALFSYEGKLCWGFNADFRLIPNLDDFREDIAWAFEELRKTTVARFLSRRTAPPEEPDRASEARQTPAPPPRIGLAEKPPGPAAESLSAAGAPEALAMQ